MTEPDIERIGTELSDILSAYLIGWKDLSECARWFARVDWEGLDTKSSVASTLGELDLLCTEVREGLRPEASFRDRAAQLVASLSCVTYSIPHVTVFSSSTGVAFEVPGLPFWSRSPQEVSL